MPHWACDHRDVVPHALRADVPTCPNWPTLAMAAEFPLSAKNEVTQSEDHPLVHVS